MIISSFTFTLFSISFFVINPSKSTLQHTALLIQFHREKKRTTTIVNFSFDQKCNEKKQMK